MTLTHKLKQTFLRGMVLAALVGVAMVATPGTARAAFVDFTVNEGAVPGTPDVPPGLLGFQADLLNGFYSASLTLGSTGPCVGGAVDCGNWDETATATFGQYVLDDVVLDTYLGDGEPQGYLIRGGLVSSGTYVANLCVGGTRICYDFTFLTQTGTLFLDADSILGTANDPILTASGVAPLTEGSLRTTLTGMPVTGSFNSNFLNNSLVNPTGPLYWPSLATLSFTTTINGDINQGDGSPNVNTLAGDVSVQFTQASPVPEPATLGMLGLGLAAAARRRRRGQNAK